MDAVVDLSWRLYPAALLMAIGAALVLWGTLREIDGFRRPIRDPVKMVVVMRGFRIGVIGLALLGIGAAWNWHPTWLLILALVIGGEETLESTAHIFALTKGKDLRISIPNVPAQRM